MQITMADDPELPITDHWRGIAKRAMKDSDVSQEQVGAAVGISQAMVSKILNNDDTRSSTFVRAISKFLKIPEPQSFASDDQQLWWELGHVLRHRDPEQYKATLVMLETMAKRLQDAGRDASDRDVDSDLDKRPTRK
jgi:transcriptional regulator with XRE-family HTH domain